MKKIISLTLMAFVVGFVSCSREEGNNNNNPTPPAVTISSTPLFYGVLGGNVLSYTSTNYSGTTAASQSINGWDETAVYNAGLVNAQYEAYASMDLGTAVYSNTHPHEDANFDAFFAVGPRLYSIDAAAGVKLFVRDAAGVQWTSNGNQSGSTFNIDAVQPLNVGGEHHIKVKASFSCKMYNNAGQSKNLTDGIYVNYFKFF